MIRSLGCALALLLIGAASVSAGAAETAPPPSAKPATPTAPAGAMAPAAPVAEVTGFRSAQYGMNEAALRAAIAKDFPQVKDIATEANTLEKTKALAITVNDLLPDSGPARINYIFGYKSSVLVQINIVWGGQETTKPETLVNTANQLGNYLKDAGYKADSIAINAVAQDGSLVVFRGEDSKGHMTLLVLRGRAEKAEKDIKLTPNILQLSYVADIRNPDIFHLDKGKF
jgi:hypothetical protein